MNDLIPITTNEKMQPVVSGRDLHRALGVETPYTIWIKRMLDYGFTENLDFVTDYKNVIREDGRVMPQFEQNHALTLNMAKELCMLQRTEAGKHFRQYFIAVEEEWNSPEKTMARALLFANAQLTRAHAELEEAKPKLEAYNTFMSSKDACPIGDAAKSLGTGQNRLFSLLRDRHVLQWNNLPYQYHVDLKRFRVIEQPWTDGEGQVHVSHKTLVTPKGMEFIRKNVMPWMDVPKEQRCIFASSRLQK